ncbi:MAG: response regulator, partial [Deltaproteobacteria bacterium]|nr:response regulator [Deltaproteobacteria bacterium]
MSETILYVEDEPGLIRLAEAVFRKIGFEGRIVPAGSLSEARLALARIREGGALPKLVVTDLGLPDGSGLELVRQIKEDPSLRAVPVVVLSGAASPETVTEAYALGANAFLSKTPAAGDLLATMEGLVRCWIREVELPSPRIGDRIQCDLARAVGYETRVAQIYLEMARRLRVDPEALRFWLDLALAEGNHANLLRFFESLVEASDAPTSVLDRLEGQLVQVETCVAGIEMSLGARPDLDREGALEITLRIEESPSEELILAGLGILLPSAPGAVATLAESLAEHAAHIADGVQRLTQRRDLWVRAQAFL